MFIGSETELLDVSSSALSKKRAASLVEKMICMTVCFMGALLSEKSSSFCGELVLVSLAWWLQLLSSFEFVMVNILVIAMADGVLLQWVQSSIFVIHTAYSADARASVFVIKVNQLLSQGLSIWHLVSWSIFDRSFHQFFTIDTQKSHQRGSGFS